MTTEERLANMEVMISEIYAAVLQKAAPGIPGKAEYRAAIEAMAGGDRRPLERYLKAGGKVYKAEEAFPESAGISQASFRRLCKNRLTPVRRAGQAPH